MPVPFRWTRPKTDMDFVRLAIAKRYNPHWDNGKWRYISSIMYFYMLLLWPLRALLMIAEQTARYGARARATAGLSLYRQILDQLVIAFKYNSSPVIYYLFKLFDTEQLSYAPYYLLNDSFLAIVAMLNNYEIDDAVDDKLVFNDLLRKAGYPVVSDISIFENGAARSLDGSHHNIPAADFIIKPRTGKEGKGLLRFELNESGNFACSDGSVYERDDLFDYLSRESYKTALLVQARLKNHPSLSGLTVKGFSTARIVTGINVNGETEIIIAVFKMQTGDSVADNFAAGGIASPICLESGELGAATSKDVMGGTIIKHPSTGVVIQGTILPYWQEALAMVTSAHEMFKKFKLLGWDVGFSEFGPVILEANRNLDIVLSQKPGSRPIGSTRFAGLCREWLNDRP